MKIAIHHNPSSFSDGWIEYCNKFDISYALVNCFDSDIIEQLKEFDGLLWHWSHLDYKSMLIAKQLIFSIMKLGIQVYPDLNTSWHFDDKLGQKYLFEAINAPYIKTEVFYEKKNAINWAKNTNFPKIFKLRGGASSVNVKFVKNKRKAKKLIGKSFSNGIKHIDKYAAFKDRIRRFNQKKTFFNLLSVFKGFLRFFINSESEKFWGREKGYVYFQNFIGGNSFDTRIIVIGNRSFGIRRYNRDDDFRASGSGKFVYEKELIDIECVKLGFKISKELETQSIALDFIVDKGKYVLVEISFCFIKSVYYNCPGYWDDNLDWNEVKIIPEYFIIEDLIARIKSQA